MVADLFVETLAAEPRIEQLMSRRIAAVAPMDSPGQRWQVETSSVEGDCTLRPFDAVVNALWEGRGAVDNGLGIAPPSAPVLTAQTKDTVSKRTLEALGAILPGVREIESRIISADVRGGWVYAAGAGSLADRASGLHRRDAIGLAGRGR